MVWMLASWNLRTLLDVDGPVEMARQGAGYLQVVDERKTDQVVREIERYKVDVAALQETKWFWDGGYRVRDSLVLAAGRTVPGAGIVKQRGRGWLLCYLGLLVVLGRLPVAGGKHGAQE